MISVGQKIDTDFSLEVVDGEEIKTVSFSELLSRPTVVSVYMKNNTGSCDKQNASLAEGFASISSKGYNVIAISKDSCNSHKKYAAKLGIGYVLASDPETEFSRRTDSIVEKKMYGKTYEGPSRSAFVIGIDGTVLAVIEKVDAKDHTNQILEVLADIS